MFSKPIPSDFITIKSPDPEKTLELLVNTYIPKGFDQTYEVAESFVDKAVPSRIFKALWEWCVFNFVYEEDKEGIEQIRLPNRTWADRNKGVDCEDFVILNAGILYNLDIPFSVRMADYGEGWQHIYIVGDNGVVLDPVNPIFNNEPKSLKRVKDYRFEKKSKTIKGIKTNFSLKTNTTMLTAAQKRLKRVSKTADKLVEQAGTKTVTLKVNKLNRNKAMKMAWEMEKEGELVASRTIDGMKKKSSTKTAKKATAKRKTTSKRK